MNSRSSGYDHKFSACVRTYASLCIYHKRIRPETMTSTLGITPDRTGLRGERAALSRLVTRNYWARSTQGSSNSRDVRYHIDLILRPSRRRPLQKLARLGCEIVIFCFWESRSANGGPNLDHQFLKRLAGWPVDLCFDIWFDLEAAARREPGWEEALARFRPRKRHAGNRARSARR